MRPVLTAAALISAASLTACGSNKDDAAGPERQTAAGEVLGGEVSDAMIPLDTVRSTAPVAVRSPGAAEGALDRAAGGGRAVSPQPEVSGGPEPLPANPSAEDSTSPPQI